MDSRVGEVGVTKAFVMRIGELMADCWRSVRRIALLTAVLLTTAACVPLAAHDVGIQMDDVESCRVQLEADEGELSWLQRDGEGFRFGGSTILTACTGCDDEEVKHPQTRDCE